MPTHVASLREIWEFDDWGNDRIASCCGELTDAQLDRPIEMGEGTLRKTIQHIYGAARNWYERWKAPDFASFPKAQSLSTLPELLDAMHRLSTARNTWFAALTDADLARPLTYVNWKNEQATHRLGDMMLHVCNHGVHHRAQAVNMLRHLGAPVPKPGPDYIFKKLAEPDQPPPKLDRDTLTTYFGYGDWAMDRVCAAAEALSDEQLDRKFEMGMGSLRKTLLHIHAAEQWWQSNWRGSPMLFPDCMERTPPAEIRRGFAQTAATRNEFLAGQSDADLLRIVTAQPRPDVTRTFPLGVTMLQLCCHGTHHRAQARNMLRHVGGATPELDLIVWVMEQA